MLKLLFLCLAFLLVARAAERQSRLGAASALPDRSHDCSWVTNVQTHPSAVASNPFVRSRYISTNTVAFQNYAMQTAVAEFQRINRALKWGAPDPVGCQDITLFIVKPSYYGLHCRIVIRNRFALLIQNNRISYLADYDHALPFFENRPARLAELRAKPNLLTKKSAEDLARRALLSIGLTNGVNIRLKDPPTVKQWEDEKGPMPFFTIDWQDKSFTGPKDAWYGTTLSFHICGVNSNVAHFYLIARPSSDPALRLPYATNFFDMLGMSATNRFWDAKWEAEDE